MTPQQARISIAVAVAPALAFEIFTAEIDRWWRRGAAYRHLKGQGAIIHIEPRLGGRLFEASGQSGPGAIEVGRVTAWEPPTRLVFSWRNATFAPHESTEVEVEFAASSTGTLVTVTHRGWESLPENHPARHGKSVADFVRMLGMWWSEQMRSLRQRASTAKASGPL